VAHPDVLMARAMTTHDLVTHSLPPH
jgi:hypothetical protein